MSWMDSCIARGGGIKIPDDVLRQGQEFLLAGLSRPISDDNLTAWMLYAVATCHAELSRGSQGQVISEAPEQATETLKDLWSKRATLTSYGQALLVLSAFQLGHEDWAKDLAGDLAKASTKETSKDGQSLASWGAAGLLVALVAESNGDDRIRSARPPCCGSEQRAL